MRIGLLGGSFNPAHEAHRAVSLLALRRLRLDRVWWIVSPGNPLKDTSELPSLTRRMERARTVAEHPRINVSDVEAQIGTRYTVDTMAFLVRRLPRVHFVWLMGADILGELHRWHDWRRLVTLMPLAVIDRGGFTSRFMAAPAALALARFRLPEAQANRLPITRPPVWTMLHGPKSALSSTALRLKTVTGAVETLPRS
jgi:nicotinate-nucleotide adenylyltransferase